jgi:hypothetical protein
VLEKERIFVVESIADRMRTRIPYVKDCHTSLSMDKSGMVGKSKNRAGAAEVFFFKNVTVVLG